MPTPSSFVDDEFDPLLNYSTKYNTLTQTDSKFLGKPISLAMLQSKAQESRSLDSDSDDENVQLNWKNPYAPEKATVWDKANPHPGYPANFDDYAGVEGLGAYDRKIPTNFQGGGSGDDQFMNSMITNYAVEKATPTGTPTGDFYLNFGAAKMGAYEVLRTHLGLTGQPAEDYLDRYMNKTWDHFDVN